ncbi:MAG: pilus assembly protein [Oscillochloris sp.]|nr:pilus assembly protein [Oscillochloris sp.]
MRRTETGQSMVEMAFVLPVLLIVLFGVMEFGYYIFAYSSVSQAARNGAEMASQLPPFESWLDYAEPGNEPANYPGFRADKCVNAIFLAIESDSTVFRGAINEGRRITDFVTISYPNGGDTRNLNQRGPIEVTINYPIRGITPLFSLLGMEESLSLSVTQRRSIENLGVDPTRTQGVACARDVAELNELNNQ